MRQKRHDTDETRYSRLSGKVNKVNSVVTTHLHPDRITEVRGTGQEEKETKT